MNYKLKTVIPLTLQLLIHFTFLKDEIVQLGHEKINLVYTYSLNAINDSDKNTKLWYISNRVAVKI